MAKKQSNGRKPGGAASIATIEEEAAINHELGETGESSSEVGTQERKPERTAKPKVDQRTNDNVSLGDIRKAAAFVNSVGGLDKAIGLLQILKVAKEVQ